MYKFIAVFDGYKMSKSTLAFAAEMAYNADAHLVGVFLDEFLYRSYDAVNVYKKYKNPEETIKKLDEEDKKKRDAAVLQFEKFCAKAKVRYSVHRNKNVALQELKHESMFADLLIISKHETFTRYKEKPPTNFIRDLLSDIQCPAVIVPAAYKPIDKAVLLYDGSPSSVFAVKMYSYIFGKREDIPVEVLTVKSLNEYSLRLPDNKLIREFIKRHFPKAEINIVKGDAEDQIKGYLRNHKENELVVLGAYRRSEISRWFKTSMADLLMSEMDTPLFIAHNK